MERLFMIIFLFFGMQASAQRETMESIDASNIEVLRIDTDEVYRIKIQAVKTDVISIKTHSEGEYFRDIILDNSIQDGVLNIQTQYPERLTGGYDKLSAHKVFSLEIEIELPENMEVVISSNLASVIAIGKFQSIHSDLKQGYCHLLSFSGAAVINTYTGNILVETGSGVIEAQSRNGKVQLPDFLPGRQLLKLKSIEGDIAVRKK